MAIKRDSGKAWMEKNLKLIMYNWEISMRNEQKIGNRKSMSPFYGRGGKMSFMK